MFRSICKIIGTLAIAVSVCGPAFAAGKSGNALALAGNHSSYYWKFLTVDGQAQLVTLFCRACGNATQNFDADVPLVAVMRDTLGDQDDTNDRLSAVWLLTYIRPGLGKRMLSAVPFFYWRLGDGSPKFEGKNFRPLLDMTALQHPMFNAFARDALQWGLLDSSMFPIRASSREYRANEADNERLHLEEAESYLQSAPASQDSIGHDSIGLTAPEIHTLIARLELRKTLIGGLASEAAAKRLGEQSSIRYESVQSRNWEMLRQWADKTGLYFEPLSLAGTSGQYAILWYSLNAASLPTSGNLHPIWKLLGIKDPRSGPSLNKRSDIYIRGLDESGNLLPIGNKGVQNVRMVPLGVYSLTYPRNPLLVVDFRTNLHLRWHEITQRSINEITAGVIGISHFTNWYYYVAADLYNFVASRHGAAVNQFERLDSYSQFRVQLQLDRCMDARLRAEMQKRIQMLAINPLESNPQNEMRAAVARYERLQQTAADGSLLALVDKDRRAELVEDRESRKQIARDNSLHLASLGLYTHRAKAAPSVSSEVARYRRVQNELNFLDSLTGSGTRPEVAFQAVNIQRSIQVLQHEIPEIRSRSVGEHAKATLRRVSELSQDAALRQYCSNAMASLQTARPESLAKVARQPSLIHVPDAGPDNLR